MNLYKKKLMTKLLTLILKNLVIQGMNQIFLQNYTKKHLKEKKKIFFKIKFKYYLRKKIIKFEYDSNDKIIRCAIGIYIGEDFLVVKSYFSKNANYDEEQITNDVENELIPKINELKKLVEIFNKIINKLFY